MRITPIAIATLLLLTLAPTALAAWTTSTTVPASFRPDRDVTFTYTASSSSGTDLPVQWRIFLLTCQDANANTWCEATEPRYVDHGSQNLNLLGGQSGSVSWTVHLDQPEGTYRYHFSTGCINNPCAGVAPPGGAHNKTGSFQLAYTNTWTRQIIATNPTSAGTTQTVTYRMTSTSVDDRDLSGTAELHSRPAGGTETSAGAKPYSANANTVVNLGWPGIAFPTIGTQRLRVTDTNAADTTLDVTVRGVHLHAIQPRTTYVEGARVSLYFTLDIDPGFVQDEPFPIVLAARLTADRGEFTCLIRGMTDGRSYVVSVGDDETKAAAVRSPPLRYDSDGPPIPNDSDAVPEEGLVQSLFKTGYLGGDLYFETRARLLSIEGPESNGWQLVPPTYTDRETEPVAGGFYGVSNVRPVAVWDETQRIGYILESNGTKATRVIARLEPSNSAPFGYAAVESAERLADIVRPGANFTIAWSADDPMGRRSITFQHISTRAPIVLIHGFLDNAREWDVMYPKLEAAGFPVVNFASVAGNSGERALQFAPAGTSTYIEEMAAEIVEPKLNQALLLGRIFPDQRLTVVAHSMGGLVTRVLVEKAGQESSSGFSTWAVGNEWPDRLDTVVMLGTPNHGTNISAFETCSTTAIWYDACTQMQVDSAFLSTFLGYDVDVDPRYFTIGGNWVAGHDGTVSATSPELPGHPHKIYPGVCHVPAMCPRAETTDDIVFADLVALLDPRLEPMPQSYWSVRTAA